MDSLFHYLFSLKQIEPTLNFKVVTAKSNFKKKTISFISCLLQAVELSYFAMYAMQQIHWQGENERKEAHALQSAWLTLLLYSSMNEIEQVEWNFSLWFYFIFFVFYVIILPPPLSPFPHNQA